MAQSLRRFKQMATVLALVSVLVACEPYRETFDSARDGYSRPTAGGPRLPYPMQPDMREPISGVDPYSVQPSEIVKVGLLLPLSGRSEKLGKALQDAAVLALFDKYATLSGPQAGIRVELVIEDTGGSGEGARKAAASAMNKGAKLLLGPVFSASVEAVKPLAATGKVALISFSNNTEVAGNGVFVMGFNPAEQADRVARYAFTRDINHVAALAPNDAYGRQVTKAFESVAQLLGRKLQPIIKYSPAGGSLNQDIRTLAREGSVGARLGFEALFLPEGSNKLGPILGGLKEANITPQTIKFLGTGLWDDKDLIRQNTIEGAWFASSPPARYQAFSQRFKNTYGYSAPRIASLGYDAVALAATLATNQVGFDRAALMDPNGFSGPANGIFRFAKDGTVQRGLAVLEVRGGDFVEIDPAPASFR